MLYRECVHCKIQKSLLGVQRKGNKVIGYKCDSLNLVTKSVLDGSLDAVNGGYSPCNDALFAVMC